MDLILIKVFLPLIWVITGWLCWQEAKALRRSVWHAENSYELGQTYKRIGLYETLSKGFYLSSLLVLLLVLMLL